MTTKLTIIAIFAALSAPAYAATVTVCSDDGSECYMKKNVYSTVGTFDNPIVDGGGGLPTNYYEDNLHRGMYCAAGNWHQGFLKAWERSPVIKPSCGR
jgi:hypothetical protein